MTESKQQNDQGGGCVKSVITYHSSLFPSEEVSMARESSMSLADITQLLSLANISCVFVSFYSSAQR